MTPDAASTPLGPPTTLWVVPVANLAGVARHVLDVARHGLPGWRLVVLCPAGPLADALGEVGAAVLTGPVSPADGVPTGVATVRRAIRSLRPRVVHSHLSYADLLTAIATFGSGCVLVTTEHGIARDDLIYHGTKWRSRLKALAHTTRLRRADALIGVSQSTLDVVGEKWHPATSLRTVVIRNGVDPPAAKSARTPGLHVVSLARLAPEKGLADLLAAFAALVSAHPQARLTIAGNGPLRGELESRARTLGVADAVDFPGHVDPAGLLADGDVLAQLSVWENTSYSILDALTHGLGVVATPVGGNPEILPPSALVDARNPAEVAAAIARQGLDPTSRPSLPSAWPTMGDMRGAITDLYGEMTTS